MSQQIEEIEALHKVISAIWNLDEPTQKRVVDGALSFCKGRTPQPKRGRPRKEKPTEEQSE